MKCYMFIVSDRNSVQHKSDKIKLLYFHMDNPGLFPPYSSDFMRQNPQPNQQMPNLTHTQTSPMTPSTTIPQLPPSNQQASSSSKRARQKKGEYYRKLEEENLALKNAIREFEQKIATLDVQNETLMHQLKFFQSCLPPGAVPSLPQENGQAQQNQQNPAPT